MIRWLGTVGRRGVQVNQSKHSVLRPYQRAYQDNNSAWNDDDMIRIKHEENGDNNDDGVVPREYQSMMIGLAEIQDR
jgi:hypothetical protein